MVIVLMVRSCEKQTSATQMKATREARIDEETTIVTVKLSLVYAGDGTGLRQ